MKRLFKKNQIIIATLAVMIAIAGYLNYSGILFGEKRVLQKILKAMIQMWKGLRAKQFLQAVPPKQP